MNQQSMKKTTRRALWVVLALIAVLVWAGVLRQSMLKPWTVMGAVTVEDSDTRKQLPIANVEITSTTPFDVSPGKSDSSGFFKIKLTKNVKKGRAIKLKFRHPDYRPLEVDEIASDKIFVVRMVPLVRKIDDTSNRPLVNVANIRVRYSMKAMRTVNVGSAVQTFQVNNVGNVPCKQQPPCSPDGKWKATIGSATLDAGLGNAFQNPRVSCIAGPCPFTRIDSDDSTTPNQKVTVSARVWSDPATFLVEAEVVHTMQSPIDHQSYPVIFGSALNFTLPTDAEGVSLEADISGKTIIFPLGPDLFLTWANCTATTIREDTSLYRCALKPGYRFQ
jgi:hypothetical protein